MIFERVPGI